MGIEEERKSFEESEFVKTIIQNFEWSDEFNNYQIKDCVINGNVFDHIEAENDQPILNGAWYGWQAAKAQAVPEGFVLLPKEPTKEMLAKGHAAFVGAFYSKLNGAQSLHCAYLAMIEAQEQSND